MTKNEILINEARHRMKQLYEYTFYRNGVFEDGEQDPMDGDTNGAEPGANQISSDPMGGQTDGGMPGQDPMGGDQGGVDGANLAPNAGQNDPNTNEEQPDQDLMGSDPMGDQMDGGMPGQDPMGGDPMGDGMPGQDPMGGDPMSGGAPGPNDNVVDITSLTDTQQQMQQAQEQMQQSQDQITGQLGDVDEKLANLMQIVDKFTSALEANDEKIRDLKRELVKRTPTEEETMNVRLNAGGNPFAQKPEEFWEKFQDINNHYNITANNDAPQYQIKKSDIDNFNDRMIDDEFDDDDEIPSSLHEYFMR